MASSPVIPKQKPGPGAGFYKEDLPGAMGDSNKRIAGRTGKSAAIMQRDAWEVDRQMRSQRPQPATVINMQPFPLVVNGVLFDDLIVPACPDGYDYTIYPIRTYKRAHKDMGDGKFAFVPVVPLQLAHEFEREFNEGEAQYGGVFYFPGDFLKEGDTIQQYFHVKVKRLTRPDDPENEPEVTIGELYKQAEDAMIRNARRLYVDAERLAADPKTSIAINERHRRAFHILQKHNLVTDAPRWVAQTRRVEEIGQMCPLCKVESKADAIVCANCKYPFDVVEAYKHGVDMPKSQLRRMTPNQLKRFGLSEEVTSVLDPEEIEAIELAEVEKKKQDRAIKASQAKLKESETKKS